MNGHGEYEVIDLFGHMTAVYNLKYGREFRIHARDGNQRITFDLNPLQARNLRNLLNEYLSDTDELEGWE